MQKSEDEANQAEDEAAGESKEDEEKSPKNAGKDEEDADEAAEKSAAEEEEKEKSAEASEDEDEEMQKSEDEANQAEDEAAGESSEDEVKKSPKKAGKEEEDADEAEAKSKDQEEKRQKAEGKKTDTKSERETCQKGKGRPSAAACGFSTVGLTDKEVEQKLSQMPTKEYTSSEKGPRKKKKEVKNAKKAEVKEDEDDDIATDELLSDIDKVLGATAKSDSGESESGSGSSTSTSSDSSPKASPKASPKPSSPKKAEKAGDWPPRPHVPKSSLYRWTTTRKRAKNVDENSKECKAKTCEEEKTKDHEVKGKVEKAKKKGEGGKKTKDEAAATVVDLPIPTHRRRHKSFRNPIACTPFTIRWWIYMIYVDPCVQCIDLKISHMFNNVCLSFESVLSCSISHSSMGLGYLWLRKPSTCYKDGSGTWEGWPKGCWKDYPEGWPKGCWKDCPEGTCSSVHCCGRSLIADLTRECD